LSGPISPEDDWGDKPEWHAAWAALPSISRDPTFQQMYPEDLVATRPEPESAPRPWSVEELEEL
jgi:hypothetical protein